MYVLLLILSSSLVGCPPFPVIILTPSDGESFELGEEITFSGSARDLQDGELSGDSLVWTSSIDGEIGTGNTFTRDDLSKGIHKITLTATNSLGEKGTVTITIPIGEQTPPPDTTTTISPDISALIGPEGGTIEVTDTSSPLYGLKIMIPEGALDKTALIEIQKIDRIPSLPQALEPIGPGINCKPDGLIFNFFVDIALPYDPTKVGEDDVVVPYAYSLEGYIPSIIDIDNDLGKVRILTTHFSDAQVEKESGVHPPDGTYKILEFDPVKDTLPFRNPGEWCAGMVALTKYHFERYPNCDNLSKLNEEKAKDLAAKVQNLQKEHKIEYGPDGVIFDGKQYSWEYTLNPEEDSIIMKEIYQKNPPVIVLIPKGHEFGHVLLAYGYEAVAGMLTGLYVYNPSKEGGEEYYNLLAHEHKLIMLYMPLEDLINMEEFEKIYESYKEDLSGMVITNEMPTGNILDKRPNISCLIESECRVDIDLPSIQMTRDNSLVPHVVSGSGPEAYISYTPDYNLDEGEHTVAVKASDVNGMATDKRWAFNIEANTTTTTVPTGEAWLIHPSFHSCSLFFNLCFTSITRVGNQFYGDSCWGHDNLPHVGCTSTNNCCLPFKLEGTANGNSVGDSVNFTITCDMTYDLPLPLLTEVHALYKFEGIIVEAIQNSVFGGGWIDGSYTMVLIQKGVFWDGSSYVNEFRCEANGPFFVEIEYDIRRFPPNTCNIKLP
jgi:hypothetical protein